MLVLNRFGKFFAFKSIFFFDLKKLLNTALTNLSFLYFLLNSTASCTIANSGFSEKKKSVKQMLSILFI